MPPAGCPVSNSGCANYGLFFAETVDGIGICGSDGLNADGCEGGDEEIAEIYESEQKMAHLVQVATLTAIFISCMGLFGLAL